MGEAGPQQIGPFAIIRLLSEGSTGRTYLGRDERRRKRYVIVKVFSISLATSEAKGAFLSHAKRLKKLKRSNIAEILDFGIISDSGSEQEPGYHVIEYIEGSTILRQFAPGKRYTPNEIKPFLSTIADTLQYAHVSHILHGNLHPGNILLGEDIRLTDFSPVPQELLQSLEREMAPALPYKAPEHLRGRLIAASDQYSLAVMVYEWLCGHRPYAATECEALLYQQEHEPLPSPCRLNNKISPTVEAVLLKALSPDPEGRFEHMLKFSDAYLRALMGFPMLESKEKKQVELSSNPPKPKVDTPVNEETTRGKTSDMDMNIVEVEFITPAPFSAVQQPENTNRPVIDGEKINEIPTPSDDSIGVRSIVPKSPKKSSKKTDEKQIDVGNKTDASMLSSDNDIIEEDEEKNAPEKLGKRPLPADPLRQQSSRLQQTVTTDLGHGGILSERLPGYEERSAQIEMATFVAQSITEDTHAIIEAATGTGKALDVNTPIPTPTGWKRMGDLVRGDFVFDEQGQPTRVMAAFDVMYHRTCYEVVFSDGSSIVADAEHEWASHTSVDRSWSSRPRTSAYAAKNFVTSDQLAMLDRLIALSQNDNILSVDEAAALIGGHRWSVYQAAGKLASPNSEKRPACYPRRTLLTAVRGRLAKDLSEQRRDGRAYTLVTTERMAATLKVGSPARANHAVSVAGPLVLPDANLPIEPYFLGIWLGDGSCYSNQIMTADPALITEIEKAGYTVRSLKSHPYQYAVDDENGKAVSRWQPGMTGRLRALGLRLNKHIPAIYLRASEQQRRALLAGLLDTDGTVNRHGAVEFTTTNSRLAQGMYELVCSLGFRPSLRCGRSRYKGKDCGPKWTLAFTTDEQVFRLERKVTAHKERLRNYTPERTRFRYVVAVREVPSRPVRCIQVESQSNLYLAGQSMIPTHNSLAYLLPIVRSRKVAIISTANKALQEQLFYKDIPFVQEHIQDFEAALVKGMGNYICLDRMERERIETQPFLKNPDFNRLLSIVKEFELNISGDFETLGFTLPNDIRIRVNADRDQCAWRDCSFFSRCYVRQMREKAAQSQIIVVNHTLLLLDAVLEGYLLPERDVIVVDEAHHLEEEATRAFTVTVSEPQISALLAQHRLKEHSQADLQEEAKQTMAFAWDRLAQIANPAYHKGRINLQEPLQEGLRLATVISKLADSLRVQRPENMTEQETILYDKLITRTQNLAEDVRKVFSVDQRDRFVYYVEHVVKPGRRGSQLEVSAAPLDVSIWLKEHLFNRSNVICTSATLATVGPNPVDPGDRGPNFAYFRSRVGLDYAEYPDVQERILPLTFDYERNAMLYLPRHLPEPVYGPESTGYTKAIAEEMMRLVEASRGRAFLLFSSKRMLDAVYNLFLDRLPIHLDFPLLRQGELNRIELVRMFRESKGAVLFGLKSFWEGVDIAGEALSLVVIDKMPFDPPDDPVHEARVARMKASGENWFGHYVLPQAVLRLKQGLGRLLRTHDDRGVMAILDTRLHTKGYGKLVINALPPACKTVNLRDIERFFEEEENAPF
jgi:Rad3-related DNA helicase/serine/threonine protein kinase